MFVTLRQLLCVRYFALVILCSLICVSYFVFVTLEASIVKRHSSGIVVKTLTHRGAHLKVGAFLRFQSKTSL